MSENSPEQVDETGTDDEQPDVIEWNGEVDALLEERRGYELHGRDDRVAEVDEQLAIRGYGEAAKARSKAAPKGVKGRSAAPGDQQTA